MIAGKRKHFFSRAGLMPVMFRRLQLSRWGMAYMSRL